jgi:lipoate-protein ligase A
MQLLDLTFPTPEENLACDEALLDEAEAGQRPEELLRLWEAPRPLVVVGYSSHIAQEVSREECARRGIPILRRPSGGAAVVAGPGCLMFALVFGYQKQPELRSLDRAHALVMGTIGDALREHVPGVEFRGTCDLTLAGRKFSGNAVRCRREHLLYHGTLLYDFPLELIEACLAMPPRQPDYRDGRRHEAFVTNLPLAGDVLRQSLVRAWRADSKAAPPDEEHIAQLVRTKYSQAAWNEKYS